MDQKQQYVLMNTEKLFYQIYVQDVINDGLGEGPSKEEIEKIYKSISITVGLFYDVQEEMQKA